MPEKKTILYIGNKLSKHGYTPTNIETLGPQLKGFYNVITTSDKKNKALRLLDIALTIVRNRKADVMLIDTYSTSAFRFAKLAGYLARKFGMPYIPILHGGDLPKRLKIASSKELDFFKRAAKLVAPSAYLFHQFEQFGFRNLTFIANNVNLDQYIFKKREAVEPKLLWVRSFHKIYNPNMALQVMRQLLQTYPNATLCMIGPDKDGSMERAKRVAATYNITNKVTFTGKLEKNEWKRLAEQYDIFINTTNVDNTPISVIEALALGLPVVSTNVGGIPYLLENETNALLVTSADAEQMTAAIVRLVKEPLLVSKLTLAGKQLIQSFDWSEIKHQWQNLIDQTIVGRS